MGMFSSEQHFLGLDLGAGSIKLVELRNEKGRPRLVTFGIYELPLGDMKGGDWSKRKEEAVQIIKKLRDQSNSTANMVIASLPTFSVFSSLINVPAVSEKELVNVIRLEAKKVIPRPMEEMILDWKEIEKTDISAKPKLTTAEVEAPELGKITGSKGVEQKKILITAAPKDLVNGYLEIIKKSGLKLVSLETEALALSRSLVGRDPSVIMVADLGAKTTNLSIIDQGIPVVNRGVNFGGLLVTEEMAKLMNLKEAAAEQWKRDQGRSGNGKLSPAVKSILDDLLHEITYLFQLYRSQFVTTGQQVAKIEKIVLTGGGAFIPGLAGYLADELNVPVHLGDPWARIVYPEELTPVLQENGPSLAVAVGLAMRHIAS